MKTPIPPGRLDLLAEAMLKTGLKLHGDPGVRIAVKMAENHIAQALTETLGPGTKAAVIASKIVSAANEFETKFREARAAIEREDAGE